ncbi:MAG: SDR family NAD(P)-dependent oxidoreductase [Rhodospirillaceae bacterium]|nr:SDR family NAD(P)-dependent oxidoreductase [Rhodospirillaceae bacterium]
MTHILITGASSGIGEALALHYAAPGMVLSLLGRDQTRTHDVAARCRAKGAAVVPATIDVQNEAGMTAWMLERDAATPLDLVIANAGVSAGSGAAGETPEQTRQIFSINVNGLFNTVLPIMAPMQNRKHGQIALMASIAGFRGLPSAPAYCASKAAIKVWGEALRGGLARDNVKVSVICPGFVVSGISKRNRFPMPFLMSAERAAQIIADGLQANRGRIAFPWPMAFMAWIMTTLPDALIGAITARLPHKEVLPEQPT